MPYPVILLWRRPAATVSLIFLRCMGGGPRTFPRGLSKWKYRRMHEKLARDKERRLLDNEEQLYYSRIRSRFSSPHPGQLNSPQHVKALADRFVRVGAEDLWNDDDGPAHPTMRIEVPKGMEDRTGRRAWQQIEAFYQSKDRNSNPRHLIPPVGDRKGTCLQIESFLQRREYSTRFRSRKDMDSDSDSEKESEVFNLAGGRGDKNNTRDGGVAKGAFENTKMRRVPPHLLETMYLRQEVQCIKEELEQRRAGVEGEIAGKIEEDLVISHKRFDEYKLSPSTIKALDSAGNFPMTSVHETILPVCLEGKDALIKAKVGAEKTTSYLLSIIETVLEASTSSLNKRVPPITALIICPTRELACQVNDEANLLLKYHAGIGAQTLIGGARLKVDQKCLGSNPSQVIVATPGRLLDHIDSKSGLSIRLRGLKVLVIDEVDSLLELGFKSDIEKIMNHVPRVKQTLVFSSKISNEVRRVALLLLKKDRSFVDAMNFSGQGTNNKVSHTYIVSCNENHFEIVYHLLKEHVSEELDYKVVIFCTTVMLSEVMSAFLRNMKMNIREIHSRKPPVYRTHVSEEFRNAKRLILITSDFTIEEMKYPNVTLVLQVGVSPNRKEYIDRLRVADSEGKPGKGILLIAPFEEPFVNEIMDLHVENSPPPTVDSKIKEQVEVALQKVSSRAKEAAYHAWLKFYSSVPDIRGNKIALANAANKFSVSIGLESPPSLLRRTVIKMGLEGIPGIQIRK